MMIARLASSVEERSRRSARVVEVDAVTAAGRIEVVAETAEIEATAEIGVTVEIEAIEEIAGRGPLSSAPDSLGNRW
jgi:hypothetical protein